MRVIAGQNTCSRPGSGTLSTNTYFARCGWTFPYLSSGRVCLQMARYIRKAGPLLVAIPFNTRSIAMVKMHLMSKSPPWRWVPGFAVARSLGLDSFPHPTSTAQPAASGSEWVKAMVEVSKGHGPSISRPALMLKIHALDSVRPPITIYAFDARPCVLRILDLVDVICDRNGGKDVHVFGLIVASRLFRETDDDWLIVDVLDAISALHERRLISCPVPSFAPKMPCPRVPALERIAKRLTMRLGHDALGACPVRIASTSVSGRCGP